MKDTHAIPPQTCPHCRAPLNRTTGAEGPPRAPEPGDISICHHCAGVAIFAPPPHGIFRLPTTKEAREMKADPKWAEVVAVQEAVLAERTKNRRRQQN